MKRFARGEWGIYKAYSAEEIKTEYVDKQSMSGDDGAMVIELNEKAFCHFVYLNRGNIQSIVGQFAEKTKLSSAVLAYFDCVDQEKFGQIFGKVCKKCINPVDLVGNLEFILLKANGDHQKGSCPNKKSCGFSHCPHECPDKESPRRYY